MAAKEPDGVTKTVLPTKDLSPDSFDIYERLWSARNLEDLRKEVRGLVLRMMECERQIRDLSLQLKLKQGTIRGN